MEQRLNIDTSASETLYSTIKSVDETLAEDYKKKVDEIIFYTQLAENPYDLNSEVGRASLFAKLSYGLRKSGEALAWALVNRKMISTRKKEAEAIALIDEFGEFLKERQNTDKSFKSTAEIRKAYVYMNEAVRKANYQEAVVEGMVEQFSIYKQEFWQAISTLRSMCYGFKDSSQASWGASAPGGFRNDD